MDVEEYVDWEALYTHIEPMPESRADLRAGVVTQRDAVQKTPQMSDQEMRRQWAKFCKR